MRRLLRRVIHQQIQKIQQLCGVCDDVSGLAGIGSQELLGLGIIIYKNWVVPGIFKDKLT